MVRKLLAFVAVLIACLSLSQVIRAQKPIAAALESAFERSLLGVVRESAGIEARAAWHDDAPVMGLLSPDERVIAVGRTADGTGMRVHTQYGYGYVPLGEVWLSGDAGLLPTVGNDLPSEHLPGKFTFDRADEYPAIPKIPDYTRIIYERGQILGNQPGVFSKVGDCMSADLNLFLGRFGRGDYDLKQYTYLEPVIEYYLSTPPREGVPNSFTAPGIAAHTGFNAYSVQDPTWLLTDLCPNTDSPLECEYRLARPALAIILFGSNDVIDLTPAQFDFFMRLIVHQTIERGIIPLLGTFPGDPARKDKARMINQIIVNIGRDYQVPVMNIWLALQPLPNNGRNPKSLYLSWEPHIKTSVFSDRNLKYGHTMRNLVTLESLNLIWREVISR